MLTTSKSRTGSEKATAGFPASRHPRPDAQRIGATGRDPSQTDVMNALRRAVHKESVAATLQADLSI